MTRKLAPLAALVLPVLSSTTGCVVYSYDTVEEEPVYTDVIIVEDNYSPIVLDGYAFVYWDHTYRDDIWEFEAVVDDPDSPYDVVMVFADVYDECRGGSLVESFELYPTNDPYVWFSDWLGSSTWLDPFNDCYTVDLVAYDSYDAIDVLTVWAETY